MSSPALGRVMLAIAVVATAAVQAKEQSAMSNQTVADRNTPAGSPAGRGVLVVAGSDHRLYGWGAALPDPTNAPADVCHVMRPQAQGGEYLSPPFPGE